MSISTIGKRLERALRPSKSRWDIPGGESHPAPGGLSHESSMIWTYHPFDLLEKSDFQSVDPSVPIKDIIKCRFSGNMKRTGHYLLRFDNPNQMGEYSSNLINKDSKLMGRALTMNTIDLLPMRSVRNVYQHIIPELRDLRHVFKYMELKEVDMLINQRLMQLQHLEAHEKATGIVVNDYAYLETVTQQLKHDIINNTLSEKTIDRSQCVVLSNFNYKIPSTRVLDMVWDLKLHQDRPLRRVMIHAATQRAVDVVIFETSEDARCGVHRWNRCHALYNDEMPYTTAEVL